MIYLRKGPTRLRINCPVGSPLQKALGSLVRQRLKEFDRNPRTGEVTVTKEYYRYNPRTGELLVPIGFFDAFRDTLEDMGFEFKVVYDLPIVPRRNGLSFSEGFDFREDQEDAARFLTGKDPGMKVLPRQTGKGKTVIAISASVLQGYVPLVVVSGLTQQWTEEFRKFTDVGDDIHILQGFKSIANLLESDWYPKVIIGSLQTVRSFVLGADNYDVLDVDWNGFLAKYGVGMKIVDEAHLNFHAVTMLDLMSNVRNNVYLSATFDRNDTQSRRIFIKIFRDDLFYKGWTYERYAKVTVYGYYGMVQGRKVRRQRGYMHAKYEGELLKRKTKGKQYFQKVILPIVHMHYVNIRQPGERMLIFFQTVQMVEAAVNVIQREYPNIGVVSFVGSDKQDKLHDPRSEIIITTNIKAGTGRDIKNLRTVMNTISYAAKTQVEQNLGRLRKLNNAVPEYIDIYDLNLEDHDRHMRTRRAILKRRSADFYETRLP